MQAIHILGTQETVNPLSVSTGQPLVETPSKAMFYHWTTYLGDADRQEIINEVRELTHLQEFINLHNIEPGQLTQYFDHLDIQLLTHAGRLFGSDVVDQAIDLTPGYTVPEYQ